MGVNLTIPATFEDALSTPEQIEWLYRNKESLLQAGANIEITRSGDRTTITAKGEGFSPTVSVVEIEGGHEVTITDGTGEHVFDVMDGVDGTSVTVTSASITGGHRLTIVSASGTTTVDVMDGTDGTDGQDGDSIVVKSVDAVEGGVNLTVTDKNGDHVIFLMNGPQGLTGPAATIQVGSTTTGEPGSNASVTNVGTSSNAVFNFAIPAGADGQDGQDGTNGRNVFIKYADAEPTSDEDMKDVPSAWIGVYNGTATSAPAHYTSYQWYNFKGAKGDDGADGTDGQDGQDGAAATVTVGSTTTGAAGSSASVTNSGTTSAAVLDFVIPKGDKGDTGDTGETGPAGADGVGVPTGGTTGQVLKKASGTDYDTEWGDDEGLPSGGNNGDVLTKATTGPMWAAPVKELPVIASGDAGKVLTVNSGETGTEWAAASGGTSIKKWSKNYTSATAVSTILTELMDAIASDGSSLNDFKYIKVLFGSNTTVGVYDVKKIFPNASGSGLSDCTLMAMSTDTSSGAQYFTTYYMRRGSVTKIDGTLAASGYTSSTTASPTYTGLVTVFWAT